MPHHSWERALEWAVLAAGGVFVVYLVGLTRPGVFYCGDSGIKYVLVEQFARGELHADMRLTADPWVLDLWNQGHYPFQPPFVYRVGERYFAKDPLFFLLVTGPAYALLGWHGLYVWPVLGLCAAWLALLYLCRRNRLGRVWTAIGLVALVFASPLTVYAAMFWEHTLSVALAFWGLALLTAPPLRSSSWNAALAGFLVGSSVWFRSEHVWLCVLVVALLPFAPGTGGLRSAGLPILVGVGSALVSLLAWNTALYGEPLGMQARQIVEDSGLLSRARNYMAVTPRLLAHLTRSGTPLLVAAITSALLLRRDDGARRQAFYWALLALGLVLGVGFFLPPLATGGDGGKQFGPRFLLLVYPLASFLLACSVKSLWESTRRKGRIVLSVVLALGLGSGVLVNAVEGALELAADYGDRVTPILEQVRSDPSRSVVVADQFAAQELSSLLRSKRMFYARDQAALMRLAPALHREGHSRFYLVTFGGPFAGEYPLTEVRNVLVLRIRSLGCTSQFCLHDATMRGSTSPGSF